ncbi:MAG: MFS transporter [Candidatus Bathyarchaeota archaeon]
MDEKLEVGPKTGSYYLILIALVLSGFTASIASMLSGLLLIDIGETFNVTVGVAGQMRTISFVVSIVFALLTSMFSVKYNNKMLLQVGLLAYAASAIGCYLAPNFNIMVAAFSLSGIGYALATTMTFTMTGLFPQKKRGEAIGFIIAGMSGSYLIGALVVPYLQSMGGWRYTFFGYMLPSSALALILATLTIPRGTSGSDNRGQIKLGEGFKAIFSNRSAFFSLLGYLLVIVTWQGILTYNTSFFRNTFFISIGEASIIILIGATLYTIGSVASSRIANRVGRKPLVVASILVASMMFMVYSYSPIFVLSAGLMCVACFLVGMMDASSTSLVIEQLPLYAGIMMSLQRVVSQVGSSLGSGLGGAILTFSSYKSMFLILGVFGIVSAMIFHWFTIDSSSGK